MRKIDVTILGFKEEIHLLKMRMASHYPYVDKIVICESMYTHMGNEKTEEDLASVILEDSYYDQYRDKISVVEYDPYAFFETPEAGHHNHGNEQKNREVGIWGISDLKNDDILYISDMDEIITPKAFQEIPDYLPCKIQMVKFSTYLNTAEDCSSTSDPHKMWWLPSAISGKHYKEYRQILENPLSEVRNDWGKQNLNVYPGTGESAGWHFSSCFSNDGMIRKYTQWGDAYQNRTAREITDDQIEDSRNSMVSPVERRSLTKVDLQNLPEYVRNNVSILDEYLI